MGVSIYELAILMILPTIILWIIAFISVLKHEFTGVNKIVWLLAVIFVPLLGSIAYFVIGRNQRLPKGSRRGA